jgi:hypothetical protein
VAALIDLEGGGRPWAICAEFQSEPDFDMSDRLLVLLGLLRLTERPSPERGDRYWVGAVVVNLTGKGLTQRDIEWRGAGLHLLLQPREWNLEEVDAGQTLDEVERGEAPREALVWLPLMKRGSEPGMIERWLELAGQETDRQRRGDLALAQVFAELVNRQDVWRKALERANMKESTIIKQIEEKAFNEGMAEGEVKGEARGEALGIAKSLIQLLEERFKTLPEDLRKAILAVQDGKCLSGWHKIAVKARSLRRFRQKAEI